MSPNKKKTPKTQQRAAMSDNPSSDPDVFDVERVQKLIGMMKDHDLSEINLKQGERQIQLKRGGPGTATAPAPFVMPQMIAPALPHAGVAQTPSATVAPPSAPQPAAAKEAAPEADPPHIKYVTSPMVGTFYSRANPDSPPFVKPGDRVAPDRVVCIVEAMKVFNEIQADLAGEVVAMLVENEEPVEYGQKLIKIDTIK